jgi:hypothetical protein
MHNQAVEEAHFMTAKSERAAQPDPTSQETVVSQYVADMSLELRSLCKARNLNYLAYLLEIVFIEANEHVIRNGGKPATPNTSLRG